MGLFSFLTVLGERGFLGKIWKKEKMIMSGYARLKFIG